jgi:hypothetical protein
LSARPAVFVAALKGEGRKLLAHDPDIRKPTVTIRTIGEAFAARLPECRRGYPQQFVL